MPLYEYECTECQNRFERIQKFSDPPIESCPTCSGKVRKLISSPAIQFKGTGWYVTDYAQKSKPVDGSKDQQDTESQKTTKADDKSSPSAGSDSKNASDSSQKKDGGPKSTAAATKSTN